MDAKPTDTEASQAADGSTVGTVPIAEPFPDSERSGMRQAMLSLAAVNALDMLLQILLPMALVRVLSDDEFGQYRMIWLLLGTALSILPMAMPASLYYFLPRHKDGDRSIYLAQTVWFMAAAGALGGIASALFFAGTLTDSVVTTVSAFVALWIFSSLLDVIYNAQQRNTHQAIINLIFAVARFGAAVTAAVVYRSLEAVVAALLLVALIKSIYCAIAFLRTKSSDAPLLPRDASRWMDQLRYAAPFGVSTSLYLLRSRADQWLVAALFEPALFGLYSVAAIFNPIQGLVRQTVNSVLLPELNRLQADEDVDRMLHINRRGNLAVAFVMFPALCFIFGAVTPVLEFLFTRDYTSASDIVRIYCIVLLIEAIEVTTLLIAFRQGAFLMKLDIVVLFVSIAASALGAHLFGLVGAALGGLIGAGIAQFRSYTRCAECLNRRLEHMQDWPTLLRIFSASCLAGGIAFAVTQSLPDTNVFLRLAAIGSCFALTYWLALRLLGLGEQVRTIFGDRIASLALLSPR